VKALEAILWPLSLTYAAGAHWRTRAYRTGLLKSRRLNGMVISVGNLTTGGTGKTPMVLWIAERLFAEGKSVGILTRGYRGKSVSGNEPATPRDIQNTSDEVQLLRARLGDRVRFGVGANRFKTGSKLAAEGVNWFVLDDGFQHLQLARDVDIVLVDAMTPFGGGQLLPAGRLREPTSALARADIVVITRTESSPGIESAIRSHSAAPIFYAQPRLDSIRKVEEGRLTPAAASVPAGGLFAFCAIGNPNGFIHTLRESKIGLVGHRFFPDHHRFTASDADQIMHEATDRGAAGLICTEKDLYNLGASFDEKPNLFCAVVSMQIQRENEFWHQVISIADERNNPIQAADPSSRSAADC
jgi:tetraacyldisaccharide 4'-kinase